MVGTKHLVGGADDPRTFQEMDEWFRSDAGGRECIRRLRWPDGLACPHCGVFGQPWTMADGLLRCRGCHGRTSPTAGTILAGTRKPLRMWFLAMWPVASQKNGVSAPGLQRVLGLGGCETAWTWLHQLRRAMMRPGRDGLSGAIEVDETYVGSPEEGKRGRQTATKAIVPVAAEKSGRGIGRIRLRRVEDVSADSLLPFVQGAPRQPPSRLPSLRDRMIGLPIVVPGSVVHTDGCSGYAALAVAGYQHQVAVVKLSAAPAHEVMPRVHMIAALLKRWLIGTHQG